ncbi:hypothetical protein IWX47DRAFT_509014 [Phyllosticta citricarpa]
MALFFSVPLSLSLSHAERVLLAPSTSMHAGTAAPLMHPPTSVLANVRNSSTPAVSHVRSVVLLSRPPPPPPPPPPPHHQPPLPIGHHASINFSLGSNHSVVHAASSLEKLPLRIRPVSARAGSSDPQRAGTDRSGVSEHLLLTVSPPPGPSRSIFFSSALPIPTALLRIAFSS